MASRKEQKEQARAARLQQEQEHAAKTARTRRFAIFGGVIAIAVIVIVVAIAISSGGSSNNSSVNKAQAKATYATVNSLIGGIPQTGTVLGQPGSGEFLVGRHERHPPSLSSPVSHPNQEKQ